MIEKKTQTVRESICDVDFFIPVNGLFVDIVKCRDYERLYLSIVGGLEKMVQFKVVRIK